MKPPKQNSVENVQFEPKIVGFLCNWCSYAGADQAGAAQTPYPPNVSVIRVMCSGRIDPEFVFEAYSKGADGILILGCHPGDCHYKEGNYRAIPRHRLLLRLLSQLGIEEERCRFDCVSASEGEKFVKVVTEMVNTIKELGPLSWNHHSRFPGSGALAGTGCCSASDGNEVFCQPFESGTRDESPTDHQEHHRE